jgi:hypothetical protein
MILLEADKASIVMLSLEACVKTFCFEVLQM